MIFSCIFLVFFCAMAAPLFIITVSSSITPIAIVAIELEILGIIMTATDVYRSVKRYMAFHTGEEIEEDMESENDQEEFESF